MSEYVIEKDIPVPAKKHAGRARTYPFDRMEVGDSIFVNSGKGVSASRAAYLYGKKNGMRFTARLDDEKNARIWRTL